jgi:hypothetical protein
MTGRHAPSPLAHLLTEAADTGRVLSTVTVRADPQTILFQAHLSRHPRDLFSLRDASVAEVHPLIPSHNPPLAIRRCP